MALAKRVLPAEPMTRKIEQRGGLEGIVALQLPLDLEREEIKQHPEYKRIEFGIQEAVRKGGFTIHWADEFCIKYLRCHPFEVFGDDWFIDLAKPNTMTTDRKEEAA